MKEYDNMALLKLCSLMREEPGAQEWLIENNCRELYEFWEAYQQVEKSFKWLLENNHRELAALVDAFHGNDTAKVFLVKSGRRDLVARCIEGHGRRSDSRPCRA